MLIRMYDWERVREEFTEMEKKILNEARTGEAICPKGIFMDMDKAGTVGVKLVRLIRALDERD